MKKKLFVFSFSVCVVLVSIIYIGSINDTPIITDKTVLDIRNTSSESLSELYLNVFAPEGFMDSTEKKNIGEKIFIPEIMSKERVIVVLDQEKVTVPGMSLSVSLKGNTRVIIDELHGNVGSTHVITVDKDGSYTSNEIYNRLLQKNKIVWYKKYSRIIELN